MGMYPSEQALDYERIVQLHEESVMSAGRQLVSNIQNSEFDDTEAFRVYAASVREAFRGYRDATLVAQAQRNDNTD